MTRRREETTRFLWRDGMQHASAHHPDQFYEHCGRRFLRSEPHAIEAYHDTASLCENPRRDRAHGVATIVLPSRPDTSRTACLTYGTIDAYPGLIASMCRSSIAGAWAA